MRDLQSRRSRAYTLAVDWDEPTEWPADARRDRLIGDWHLHQRRGGHRTSTDDLVTAWFSTSRSAGTPARYLDLGCGIGSVLLMTAHRLRPGTSLGLEAQPQSALMARRSISELPEGAPPIEVVCSDFRSWNAAGREFELITGSPPYFPLSAGVLPADAQRRGCRFEARGGIEAYCATAAALLAPGGRFFVVFQTAGDQRVLAAAGSAGLALHARLDLHMRTDRPGPFLTVYELAREQGGEVDRQTFSVRDRDGEITEAYQRIRRELGVAT